MNRKPDAEVLAILDVVRMCQSLNVLPRLGGLLDQDAYFAFLLARVLGFDEERQALENARAKARVH
jgi:hypothetical protein